MKEMTRQGSCDELKCQCSTSGNPSCVLDRRKSPLLAVCVLTVNPGITMEWFLESKDTTALRPTWRATGFKFDMSPRWTAFLLLWRINAQSDKNFKVTLRREMRQCASFSCPPTLCCASCVLILSGSLAISSSESKDFSDSSSHSISLLQASWNCKRNSHLCLVGHTH